MSEKTLREQITLLKQAIKDDQQNPTRIAPLAPYLCNMPVFRYAVHGKDKPELFVRVDDIPEFVHQRERAAKKELAEQVKARFGLQHDQYYSNKRGIFVTNRRAQGWNAAVDHLHKVLDELTGKE